MSDRGDDLLAPDRPPASSSKRRDGKQPSGAAKRRRRREHEDRAGGPLSAADTRDVAVMLLEVIGSGIAARDPVCGPVLIKQARPLADVMVQWSEQSEGVERFLSGFSSGTKAGLIVATMAAVRPLVETVGTHHVRPALERRRERLAELEWPRGPLDDEGPWEPEPASANGAGPAVESMEPTRPPPAPPPARAEEIPQPPGSIAEE